MVERQVRFGELNVVRKNVMVGQVEIHPGDTVQQQYGQSKTVQLLVRDVDPTGALVLYDTPHVEAPIIYPGAKLDAVYCPH